MKDQTMSWTEICLKNDVVQAAAKMAVAHQVELDFALGEAAWVGKIDLVELLLARANPMAILGHGETALHKAVSGPSSKCVQALLKASNLDARSHNGTTPTMKAAISSNPKVLSMLLTPERARETNLEGWSPIAFAVYAGSEKAFSLLAPMSDMAALTHDGKSLLSVAIEFARSIPLVEALATPEALAQKDGEGRTPVEQAKARGQRKIHKILLARETAYAEQSILSEASGSTAPKPTRSRI